MIFVKDKPGDWASMEVAKVFKRFSSLSAGAWVGLALLLGAGITYYAERRMLEQATTATLHYFQRLPRFMVTSEDFVRLKEGEEYDRFDRLIKARFFTPHIFCVKIYDRDSRLAVWHCGPDEPHVAWLKCMADRDHSFDTHNPCANEPSSPPYICYMLHSREANRSTAVMRIGASPKARTPKGETVCDTLYHTHSRTVTGDGQSISLPLPIYRDFDSCA